MSEELKALLDWTPTGGLNLPKWQVELRGASACLTTFDQPLSKEFRSHLSDMLGRHQAFIEATLASRAAIAALRSTTPASDVAEAENYASELVKGEALADVSRADVDDDALVEWLRSHAKYVKSLMGAGKGTLFFDADIEKLNAIADRIQSLQTENAQLLKRIAELGKRNGG